MFSLTGCWSKTELNELGIVAGVAIDKANNSDEMELTFQVVQPIGLKNEEKSNSNLKPYFNITNNGLSMLTTIREFSHESSRKMYLAHNQILIFGNTASKVGLQKYIDFYLREPETRTSVWMLVSEGNAIDILQATTDIASVPAKIIAELVESQRITSHSTAINFQNFISRLISKTTSPIASWIELQKEPEGKKIHHISGTAVFKKDKLIGKMDETETRGLNWVLGEVKGGVISIESPSGKGIIEFEITKASSDVSAEFKDGVPSIRVKIIEVGSLSSQSSSDIMITKEGVVYMEKSKEKAIRNEIIKSIKKAKELNADVFGFGEALRKKYPKEWNWIEGKWNELFLDLNVEIDIETTVERSGMITKSVLSD
jgi:Ger(x)C family germination protein